MAARILIFYGSYRRDRQGIRLAEYLLAGFAAQDKLVQGLSLGAVK